MGHFELAGSTIILLLEKDTGDALSFMDQFCDAFCGKTEIEVSLGETIAVLGNEKTSDVGDASFSRSGSL